MGSGMLAMAIVMASIEASALNAPATSPFLCTTQSNRLPQVGTACNSGSPVCTMMFPTPSAPCTTAAMRDKLWEPTSVVLGVANTGAGSVLAWGAAERRTAAKLATRASCSEFPGSSTRIAGLTRVACKRLMMSAMGSSVRNTGWQK